MGAPVAGTGSPDIAVVPGQLFILLRGISGGWCVGAIVLMVLMIGFLDDLASVDQVPLSGLHTCV